MNSLTTGKSFGWKGVWHRRLSGFLLLVGMIAYTSSNMLAQNAQLLSSPALDLRIANRSSLAASADASPLRRPASPAPDTNAFFSAVIDNFTPSPPSIAAVAGTNALMVVVNSEIRWQDKTGTLLKSESPSDFWGTTLIGPNGRVFGSKLAYDPFANKWIYSACANPDSPDSALLLAISLTSDPTLNWSKYKILIDPTNNLTWCDVGGLGFNDDWIVISKNLRLSGGNTFSRSRVYVFDKSVLYDPLVAPVGNILSTNVLLAAIEDFTVSSLMPAVSYDTDPGKMYLMANGQGDDGFGNGTVRLFRLTAVTNVFSFNQIAQPVGNSSWSDLPNTGSADFLPQKGSASLIAPGDSRIQNLVLRNGTLWCAQTVFLPPGNATRASVQWWELNTNGTVNQFGRVDDPLGNKFYAYPSIAVNRNNDVLVGYSGFSADEYPSANYSFRSGTYLKNNLEQDLVYQQGKAPYVKNDPNSGLNRWGEYSATVVDPVNDLDMWTVQEYAFDPFGNISRWATWWARILLSVPADGILEVVVDPPSGSVLRAGAGQVFTVRVFDTFGVTNATVKVDAPGIFVLSDVQLQNEGGGPDLIKDDNSYAELIQLVSTNTSVTVNATFSITAPGATNLTFTNIYTIAPPPANDFFANAIKIPERLPDTNGLVFGGNFFASLEFQEPIHAGVAQMGSSVWWYWAPVQSNRVLIDTLGSGFNTVLAVYTNNTVSSLGLVASANDVTNQFGKFLRDKAFVHFNAIAGQTYRIAVAGASINEFGNIRLRMAINGETDKVGPVVTVTNILVGGISRNSGNIVTEKMLTLSGTAVDPVANSSGLSLVQITGNNGIPVLAFGTNEWTTLTPIILEPGANLLRVVAFDHAGNQSVAAQIALTLRAFDPVNDIFANALPLTNLNGSVTVDSSNAGREGNEPVHAGKIGGKSIWYSFTAPDNGVLTLRTTNSSIDTLLALYTGDRINELVLVLANDDVPSGEVHSEVSSGVVAGTKYSIAVDGLDGAGGTIVLHHSFVSTTIYTLTVTNTAGGSILPGGGLHSSNSHVSLTAVTNDGFTFITWVGDIVTLDNPLGFNITSNMSLTAVFGRREITDDFEAGVFNGTVGWIQAGDGSWVVTNNVLTSTGGGTFFARSGEIGNAQTSELRIVHGMRAGLASFSYKISSEVDFDKLDFYVNGVIRLSKDGEIDWTKFDFDVPAGTNTLSWVYRKDVSSVEGLDAVFIDNVDLPLLSLVDTNVVLSLNTNAIGIVNSEFQLRIEGQTNQLYLIQVSSDLADWRTLVTNHAPFGIIQFIDTNSSAHMIRFYRAKTVD